jgi:hypothetical protein
MILRWTRLGLLFLGRVALRSTIATSLSSRCRLSLFFFFFLKR